MKIVYFVVKFETRGSDCLQYESIWAWKSIYLHDRGKALFISLGVSIVILPPDMKRVYILISLRPAHYRSLDGRFKLTSGQ